MSSQVKEDAVYTLVANIPKIFQSKDLRNYFSYFIEMEAFVAFHYRHRPETVLFQTLEKLKAKAMSFVAVSEEESKEVKLCKPNFCKVKKDPHKLQDILLEENWLTPTKEVSPNVLAKPLQEEYLLQNVNPCQFSDWKGNLSILDSILRNSVGGSFKNSSCELTQENLKEIASDSLEEERCRCCCFILIKKNLFESFKALYNEKFWVNRDGLILPLQCLVYDFTPVLNLDQAVNVNTSKRKTYQHNPHEDGSEVISLDKMNGLLEFKLPPMMPQGNVGTSTSYFKQLLDQCKLPASFISKLELDFKKRSKMKYSQVHFNYKTGIRPGGVHSDQKEALFTKNGNLIPGYFDIKFNKSLQKKSRKKISGPILELEREEEDGAEVEEWERFESFHDDVTKQERTKERVYESEIEQVWEKGGPGLVFYTDAQFWRVYDETQEETDEWDVDVSTHYGEGGDLDARASSSMTEMDELRDGKRSSSVFKSKSTGENNDGRRPKRHVRKQIHEGRRNPVHSAVPVKKEVTKARKKPARTAVQATIGSFEQHSKGFGSQMLKNQGWKQGEGLGRDKKGMAYALDPQWKHPLDKSGLGFKSGRKRVEDPASCEVSVDKKHFLNS